MNTRDVIRRHGRTTAVAGAVLAVSSAALMTVVATANAAPQNGVCADTVNVRHDPDITSRIVAVCDSGKKVTVAETKNGFVHLTDLGGWAAQEFVSVHGHTPAAPVDRQDSDDSSGDDAGDHASSGAHHSAPGGSHGAPGTAAKPAPAAPAPDTANDNDPADNDSGDDNSADNSGADNSGDQAGDDSNDNDASNNSGDSGSDDSNNAGDDSSRMGLLGS
jgi:hypothetical protein